MTTLTATEVRSISMRGMPAEPNSLKTWSRICLSCSRNFLKSFLLAYQRERQGSMTGMRKPVGWIFCPMCSLGRPLGLALLHGLLGRLLRLLLGLLGRRLGRRLGQLADL